MESPAAKGMAKAIEYMDKWGWHKGSYGDKDKGFCILGALYHNLKAEHHGDAEWALLRAIKERGCFNDIPVFNDDLSTTRVDIDAVMQRAREILIQDELNAPLAS